MVAIMVNLAAVKASLNAFQRSMLEVCQQCGFDEGQYYVNDSVVCYACAGQLLEARFGGVTGALASLSRKRNSPINVRSRVVRPLLWQCS